MKANWSVMLIIVASWLIGCAGPAVPRSETILLSFETERILSTQGYCREEDALVPLGDHDATHHLRRLERLVCGHWMAKGFRCGFCIIPERESVVWVVNEKPRYIAFGGRKYFYPVNLRGYPGIYGDHYEKYFRLREKSYRWKQGHPW